MFKSGFVSIVGRPNVGKSTLMNNVVGEKIAIMSDKPQTTRNTIQAVYTDEECQIVFLDTPGIHKPKNKLGEFMVKSATDAFKNVDLVLFVVDDSKKIGPGDRKIIEDLRGIKTPVILVLNKIDKLEESELFELMQLYSNEDLFKAIVPISALKGRNVNELLKVIGNYLQEGPKYFPDYMITDQPERVLVSELIREKVLHYLNDEVPHGVAVEVERMKTGFPVSERYLAISRIFLFVCPVRILCCSSSICLISSITRSVTFISSWNLLKNGSSLVNGFPQVSSVVLIPLSLAFWNNSSRKSICRSGSPPLTVIPPLLPQ